MRGLKHTILLRNTENGWKIIIDIYEDELKKFLNKTKFKKKQAIEQIQKKSFVGETDTDSGLLDAPSDQTENYRAGTFHSYDKSDAVSYAHTWAYDRNSAYGDFSNMGGDCTNFCSQVIRAGGAPMDSGGSYTWYYYGYSSRSPSWTGVNQLYSYLAANWYTGPAGSVTSISGVQTGDIVQLDFDGDNSYDHSVVVVSKVYENGAYNIKIAAHSTDRDNYPLSSYSWSKKIRYIHIDGYYD
ncbi:MAG: amidase domain-containing protein [Desulfobacteraceae bacterium]|nr:amidase domain-containing protein [Desulfobacteraceae bacterium]